jgi:outer membrane protein assembly factor BamB
MSATPLIVDRGTLFFKENGGTTLYALDPDAVALKWKYTDSEQSNLAGVDAGDVYLFSHEVLALRRDTQALRWSTRLTVSVPGRGARVGDAGVLVCTPRGLFQLSKETGDLVSIFRGDDRESAGGSMVAVGGKLICVSNMAITAYPDPSAATR